MRRKDREITNFDEIIKIVDACEIVRLGLADGEYPYIVPLNFAYEVKEGRLYLYVHGAMAGRKYELLRQNAHCSFEMDIPLGMVCIYEKRDVTMRYRCVMGKATAEFLEGEERRNAVGNIIMARRQETRNFPYKQEAVEHTAVIRLAVTELTTKANVARDSADE